MTFGYDALRRNTQTVLVPKAGAATGKRPYTTKTYTASRLNGTEDLDGR